MTRDEIVGDIVERERGFFQAVENIGGRASCQDMPHTFSTMRRSQYAVWSDAMLESWRDDLLDHERRGENPVALKYAYMMERTHPAEFSELRGRIPAFSPPMVSGVSSGSRRSSTPRPSS